MLSTFIYYYRLHPNKKHLRLFSRIYGIPFRYYVISAAISLTTQVEIEKDVFFPLSSLLGFHSVWDIVKYKKKTTTEERN